jgi:RNA polymerase sigma-70 factor (ECF subfamily)
MAYAVKINQPFLHKVTSRVVQVRPEKRERMTEGNIEPKLATQTPAAILPRIAAGERAAVQECIDTYGGLVWSLARRLSPSPEEAEDAVQEIFIDLWKSADRYDTARASEVTWVAMIARRRLIDRRRATQRVPAHTEISDVMLETLPDPVRRFDQVIEISSEAAVAAKALQQLKPTQQVILQMAVYQGLTHQEIAEATGLPLGTVKTHVRRGLLHIRRVLGVRTVDAASFAAEEVQS